MSRLVVLLGALLALLVTTGHSFTAIAPLLSANRHAVVVTSKLFMGYDRGGKPSSQDRSKRQERVGHLVRSELGQIIHTGLIKGDADFIESDLRKRISIINVDVSPDLRQARVTVSIRQGTAKEDATVDRRRAYSWLVSNTKPLRHTLAQRMAHMKTAPNLSFVQADVSAAVDVMYLIDKVAAGAKRSAIGSYGGDDDSLPHGMVEGMDFDDFDDGDWFDEDDDVFMDEGVR